MGLNGINFVVGILTGIVMTSIIWGVVISLRIKRNNKSEKESNEITGSIAQQLADIENTGRLYKNGKVKRDEFKKIIESKYEAINRELKSSMHFLDIYFVKYVELFLNVEGRVDSKEIALQSTTEAREESDATATKLIASGKSENADESFAGQDFDENKNENTVSITEKEEQNDSSENKKDEELSNDSFLTKNQIIESETKGENISFDDSIAESPDKENSKNESEQEVVVEDEDIDSFEANIPEEFIAPKTENDSFKKELNAKNIDKQNYSKQEDVPESKNDFSLNSEEIAVKEFKTQKFDQEEHIEDSENEADFEIKSDQTEILSDSDDEDFSMETIMDYDMSNIKNIASGDNVDSELISSSDDSPGFSEFSKNSNEEEILCETIQFDPSDKENGTINDKENRDEKKINKSQHKAEETKDDNNPSAMEINSSFSEENDDSQESKEKDVAITGDDVANKIDSFFGFKN